MPSTAPPVPTAKTTPCSSADQGGQGWRGQPRGKVSEKGGEETERPSSAGVCSWGVRTSPLGSPPRRCHLRNWLIDFHQKFVAGGARWDTLARLPASSRINGTSVTSRTRPFSKTSLSKEAEPAIPQILTTPEGFKSASGLRPLLEGCPFPSPFALVTAHHPAGPHRAHAPPSSKVTGQEALDAAELEAKAKTEAQGVSSWGLLAIASLLPTQQDSWAVPACHSGEEEAPHQTGQA